MTDRITIWTGRDGDIAQAPPYGAILRVDWAVRQSSYEDWYPTIETAKAALAALAAEYHRLPSDNGMYVDLTADGCIESYARVSALQPAPPAATDELQRLRELIDYRIEESERLHAIEAARYVQWHVLSAVLKSILSEFDNGLTAADRRDATPAWRALTEQWDAAAAAERAKR